MRSFLSSAIVVSLLGLGTALPAQEAPAADSGEFDIGQSVAPAVGDRYEADTFGDWSQRCVKAPEGQEDRCNLYQLLSNDEGVAVAEMNIFRLPDNGDIVAGATIVVPLETFLPEQMTLAVDAANPRRYPYRFCNQAGCVARLGFTRAEVDEFKAGASGSLRIVPAAAVDQEVVVTFSLSGFTAGYDALSPLPLD